MISHLGGEPETTALLQRFFVQGKPNCLDFCPDRMEKGQEEETSTMMEFWLAGWIAAALAVYLIYALMKPEKF